MAGMAGSATADRTVRIGPSDLVALYAAFGNGGRAFMLGQRVRCAFHGGRVKLLGCRDLFRREVGRTGNGGPRRRRVATAQVLIVLRLMALGTIGGREVLCNDEAAMIHSRLTIHRMMAVKTCDSLRCMLA